MTDNPRTTYTPTCYPPGYLDTLRGGGPLSFGRDSEGREVLEMKGTRVVTLTAEMQALDHAWRAWTRLGSTLRCCR